MDLLIEFRHGLGDAVQLSVVLQHLRHYHPEWNVDVAVPAGKHSLYKGLCRKVFVSDRDPIDRSAYNQVQALDWHECHAALPDAPSTKAVRCLQEVFGLTPVPELCKYQIQRPRQAGDSGGTGLPDGNLSERPDAEGRFRPC